MFLTTAAIATLLTFNGEVARLRGEERIFIGAQLGDAEDSGAYAWTKCVPESGVFIMQVSEKLVAEPPEKVLWAARHEICHVRLHGKVICSGGYASLLPARRLEMDNEANQCAVELLAGVE